MDREFVIVCFYVNIVIIKYWGKKKEKEMVFVISSIFLILENMYIEMVLLFLLMDVIVDVFYINGLLQSEVEYVKMSKIIDCYCLVGEGFV